MRWLGYGLAGCVALAVLRAIMWAGAVLWGLLLLYALIRHPEELCSFFIIMLLLIVAQGSPIVSAMIMPLLMITALSASRKRDQNGTE